MKKYTKLSKMKVDEEVVWSMLDDIDELEMTDKFTALLEIMEETGVFFN